MSWLTLLVKATDTEDAMLAAYERRLILSYLSNAASRLHHRSPEARALADWITANDDWLALTGPN